MPKSHSNPKKTQHRDDYFRTEQLQGDLKRRSVRGGLIVVAAQGVKFTVQTGGTLVLAHFLVREDFGLVAMVTAVVNFVALFKDLGLSTATIQRETINHEQVSTLFWANFGVSILVSLVIVGLAPLVSWFYTEPRLALIMMALASSFIFSGLGVQHAALLKRQMCFAAIAKAEMGSIIFSVFVGILAAYWGAGYWSLILWRVTQAVSNGLLLWFLCPWRPGRPAWAPGTWSMLTFGSSVTGFTVFNFLSRNLDNILIGKYWGPGELGLYTMAYRLLLLPIQQLNAPVTSVALPALSRLQTDPQRYSRYYYKAIGLITMIGMPIVSFLFIAADKVILVFLGEKWTDVVIIFRCLMPAAFIGTFNVATGWTFLSLGKTTRLFRWGLFSATANALIFMVSVQQGVVALALAYSLTRPLFLIAVAVYSFQGTPLRLSQLIRTLFRPTVTSLVAAISVYGMNLVLQSNTLPISVALLIDGILFLMTYLLAWLLIPGGPSKLQELINMKNELSSTKST